jgi:CelD/BcsL family acetyltransferase involved in cellulose biosynthesis
MGCLACLAHSGASAQHGPADTDDLDLIVSISAIARHPTRDRPFEVVTMSELGWGELARWEAIRGSSPSLASPYFSSSFATVIGRARHDCRVALVELDGALAGFFPFHSRVTGVAGPLGRKLADYQGVVLDPAVNLGATELLRRSGLVAYRFDHLAPGQPTFSAHVRRRERSAVIELDRGGFNGYLETRARLGGHGPQEATAKRRKLERDHAVRFVFHENDPAALETLLRWKSEQYHATKTLDLASRPWVARVLRELHATQEGGLRGTLSCLYADDALIAVHLGLRSGSTLHSQFPAFDRRYFRYSPGMVLLFRIIEAAAEQGIATIDLGKGEEPYKARFCTGAVGVGSGSVETNRAARLAVVTSAACWAAILRTPLYHRAHRLHRRLEVG